MTTFHHGRKSERLTLAADIGAKQERARKRTIELVGSLALEELWPEVFEHGGARVAIVGSPSDGYRYRITRNDGSSRQWGISKVPVLLLDNYLERTIARLDIDVNRHMVNALRLQIKVRGGETE